MSILLDAVTRAKQQQLDDALDPVLAPRMPQEAPRSLPWKPALVVVAALVAGGAMAYGWQQWHVPPQPLAAVIPKSEPAVKVAQSEPVKTEPSVRMAGRAALPIAQPLPAPQVRTTVESSPPEASDVNVGTQPQTQPQTQSQTESPATTAHNDADEGNEPIILGAQPNQRGLQALKELKGAVQTAADESGIEDQPQPATDDQQALIAKFQAALSEVERRNAIDKPAALPDELKPMEPPAQLQYPSYGNLPASLQLQVPEFNITAHMYATDPAKRWLNVDGKELQQGDKIKGKLTIIEIRPQDVVLEIQGTRFKVPAI
ncbi:general secretion pathway protein GspB [Shewanella yunxiaonensis]|uniref:General secretion pathway protein GspB n=1 Tax=Shewanella yunxiaonensis TaxID=2829809 RepID=A0ABX7YS72_9GAMM|nr:general secretion pathway protein GspB [Shewanella yunxiaonensis]QUN04976.1 general secretion pathway protein GspB [Shewanella yunxiaonensis]